MEFNERLQRLRHREGLTQEELAGCLNVTRTAISKWESGRGYPTVDSLKAISRYFSVSLDELLASDDVLGVAQAEAHEQVHRVRDVAFGLLDCGMLLLAVLPVFGLHTDGGVQSVQLAALVGEKAPYVPIAYVCLIAVTSLFGIASLSLRACGKEAGFRARTVASCALGCATTLVFIATQQPYAAALAFAFCLIKMFLLVKRL